MRRSLLRTFPGRLLLYSAVPLALLWLVRQFITLPAFFDGLRRVLALATIAALVGLIGVALASSRRRILWRVRRKLILSYVLLGAIPVVLVSAFVVVASWVLYTVVVAYAFHEAYADVAAEVGFAATTVANDVERTPGGAADAMARGFERWRSKYPDLSMIIVPVAVRAGAASPPAAVPASNNAETPLAGVSAGDWRHVAPPAELPAWAAGPAGFSGTLAYERSGETFLVLRTAVLIRGGRFAVLADLPVNEQLATQLEEQTGTRLQRVTLPQGVVPLTSSAGAGEVAPVSSLDNPLAPPAFRQSVAFMDFVADWPAGQPARVTLLLVAPLDRIVSRLVQPSAQNMSVFVLVLISVGTLLLVIQGSAFFMGGLLVRSITSAVHELFAGTERLQQGDFAHRITIESDDQLGDLAASFNRMSAGMEHAMHVQREKQRLDDELRIAREIQKSLLPVTLPQLRGLAVADLCEPAREVGGDYYDFFDLGPDRLGVLVADVSGKGTSAALYMAELKGLMLALSHTELSPRRLLIDVNRRLANQLDNRSFITMTYAVFDLAARTMTCARAGHTPLLIVSGSQSQLLAPSGMVVGLRIPGAEDRFEEVLEDHTVPIRPGDVVVMYTDGVTEAMNVAGDLFGDEGLAKVVAAHEGLEPAGIRERVLREVRAFAGEAEQHDDMTMIVLKIGEREAS